jgi:hypothetical protein
MFHVVSRDKALEGYFDRVPEIYRRSVRGLTLSMSIDIMKSRSQLSQVELEKLHPIQLMNPRYVEIRRRESALGTDEIRTHYVAMEHIDEAYETVSLFFNDMNIPFYGEGQLRYYTSSQSKDAKGGRVVGVKPTIFDDGHHIWPIEGKNE